MQPALAQHATANDITDGERAFGMTCVACHGPDGDLIAGIDLGRGLFRRAYSDDELVGIILNGIPDTPMPPNPGMSRDQAERIVAYLRELAAKGRGGTLAGDPDRGRELFFGAGQCTDCHAVNGRGARHGPDLTSVGLERRAAELETALLDPAAAVQPDNRSYRVVLGNGQVVTGRLLNHDTFTVQLLDSHDRLRSFDKSELRDYGFVATPMPNYGDQFTTQEIADLVSYLTTLQGTRP
jgi:putative heme-binding domain-containing protein